MTSYPTDPAAYHVEINRYMTGGPIRCISILVTDPDAAGLKTDEGALIGAYHADDDRVDVILRLARDEERTDPHSDKLPSDRAIIMAAMRDCGIDPDEEGEEPDPAEQHERDTFVPHPGQAQETPPVPTIFDLQAENDALRTALATLVPLAESCAEDLSEIATDTAGDERNYTPDDVAHAEAAAKEAWEAVEAARALLTSTGPVPPIDAGDWNGVLVLAVTNDSDQETRSAGEWLIAAAEDIEFANAVAMVASGDSDEARIGGGAAPLVVFTRA